MSPAQLLVVAKAPEPGRVKTRLGSSVGPEAAAWLAAAALADTLVACAAYGPQRCFLALDGDLDEATDATLLRGLLVGWTVFSQEGEGLAERLVNAHGEVAERAAGGVLQVGMDTPQLRPDLLSAVEQQLGSHDAVLGPAHDGGWWVLAAREPRRVAPLAGVPMSTPTTGEETRRALERSGLTVARGALLRDVDTVADAEQVAALVPGSRFARVWARVSGAPGA